MNIMSSVILFVVFVVAYVGIIEVFTVLFRLTGLTKEKARTQVVSMLTNSGFTTSESEVILASSKRRKLAQITMLFGYSFTVIIVSMIVNIFLALSQTEIKQVSIAAVVLLFLVIIAFFLLRLRIIQTQFDNLIEKVGNRMMFGKKSNPVVLIDLYDRKAMVEIFLENVPEFLRGVCLADSQLKKNYDIHVLFVKRGGETIDLINGETILKQQDILFLFGNYKNIRQVFERPKTQ